MEKSLELGTRAVGPSSVLARARALRLQLGSRVVDGGGMEATNKLIITVRRSRQHFSFREGSSQCKTLRRIQAAIKERQRRARELLNARAELAAAQESR